MNSEGSLSDWNTVLNDEQWKIVKINVVKFTNIKNVEYQVRDHC